VPFQPSPSRAVEHEVQLLGRRKSERRRCNIAVGCEGTEGAFRGRLVNVSRTGALLHLSNAQFRAEDDTALVEVFTRLHQAFPDGLTIYFLHCKAAIQAALVRIARQPDDALTVVGCQFARPLSDRECEMLGVSKATAG
jgi:hypothetical protein